MLPFIQSMYISCAVLETSRRSELSVESRKFFLPLVYLAPLCNDANFEASFEYAIWITKLEAIKMQFVCVFFHICRKFESVISQGSVATCVRWDRYCHMCFVANFICFPAVQNFWKSVKIWQCYRQLNGGNFFETQCIMWKKRQPLFLSACVINAELQIRE